MKTIRTKNSTTLVMVVKMCFYTLILAAVSCDSFVEVELPKSQLTSSTVFQDYTTSNAAMADVYAKIRDKGLITGTLSGVSAQLGYYADELTFYGASNTPAFAFYSNTVLPSNTAISTMWNNTYNQIYAANAVLEGTRSSGITLKEKAQLQGEALFIRGLLHFYLFQLFGDIPYPETTDYKLNSTISRLPSDQVYIHIIKDLKKAEELLPPTYTSTERVRANSFVVKALLARVYLYTGKWNDAIIKSTEVIENNSLYVFEETINNVFLKGSTEAIWQFMPSLTGKNTDEAILFTFTLGPPPMVALSESLMSSFDANDLRKTNWITAITSGNKTWYHATKYKESKNSTASKEYSTVLRLTELYLIRAEARAQEENYLGAKEDLNKIRKRAGLSNVTANTKGALLDAILEERRKELFTEYGHRFFDLKRSGKLDAVLAAKPGWDAPDRSLPIPESELLVNPKL